MEVRFCIYRFVMPLNSSIRTKNFWEMSCLQKELEDAATQDIDGDKTDECGEDLVMFCLVR